jgi:hypothetical protein
MKGTIMEIHKIYFAKNELYDVIRKNGGQWNDSKERPLVCLMKIREDDEIYWAIPMGNWNHRNEQAKKRILNFINRDKSDIGSCYYHIGNTTTKSIFFISDVIPITEKYIEREYLGYDDKVYEIKNKKLLSELKRKLNRILYYEESNPNFFRQHITSVKEYLMEENSDS